MHQADVALSNICAGAEQKRLKSYFSMHECGEAYTVQSCMCVGVR